MDYIKIFQTHFQPLIDAGLLKFPSGGLKPVYKIRYEYYGGKSERSKSYVTNEVDYYKYDFSKYNYEEFLCPFEEHLDLYDAMLFALKHVPTQQLIDIFIAIMILWNK